MIMLGIKKLISFILYFHLQNKTVVSSKTMVVNLQHAISLWIELLKWILYEHDEDY